jgi:hypothetical protein
MKNLPRPVLTTVLFGLIGGMSFIPLNLVLSKFFFGSNAICMVLWLFTAGYAVLLCRWSRQKLMPVSYPILFLLLTVFMVQSIDAFFFLALAVNSWIRSGICYQGQCKIRLPAELLLCVAGGALVAVFTPGSALAGVLSIWLFFLLQALYFAFFGSTPATLESQYDKEPDLFERASRQAEDILSAMPPI